MMVIAGLKWRGEKPKKAKILFIPLQAASGFMGMFIGMRTKLQGGRDD